MNDNNTIVCVCNEIIGPEYFQKSPIPGRPGFYSYLCSNPECPIRGCSLGAAKIEQLKNSPEELEDYKRGQPK